MEELHKLTTEALIDLLLIQTEAYLQMHTEGTASDEEFEKCRLLLKVIQKEIRSRDEYKAEQEKE